MKKINYLSPSAIAKYREDPEAFYLHYLCETPPGREPQTQPMAIGSSFDAYTKSWLHERLFGKGNDPRFEFNAIFEAQVEKQHRDWARIHGGYVFECYKKSGALEDLLLDMTQAVNVPKFEFEIKGAIEGYREGIITRVGGVIFLGKPDFFYINKYGAHVILDLKVNGYCSKYPKSPNPGYIRLRADKKKSGAHKDAKPLMWNGILINSAAFLENIDKNWATQLSIYAWLAGCQVGEEFCAAIDQICCSPLQYSDFPDIRIAEHRMKINSNYQWEVYAEASEIWDTVQSDHFFRNLTLEESKARCALLDQQAASIMIDPQLFDLTRDNRQYRPR